MRKLILFLFLSVILSLNLKAQKSVKIWIVRHAEKDISNVADKDPDLSEQGKIRAETLMKELKGKGIDSIFSTPYKRTKFTAFPLADRIGLVINTYDPAKPELLAERIRKYSEGKKILIVGHSNTILPLIKAFGGQASVKEIKDEEYGYIFTLLVKANKTDVEVSKYGDN
ncbi:histidine phosphatase family protein [Pedobacter montanisoli]|uniref:Histidine phosphatase family protein n=1 Tax=Pedobacter montanisoli TaxID=2923277 RepID=A0ABS9ZT22_9SPHI|nr:histidine phosphatase family protein [Pedobacter montanisoli]MCJ0741756.1 histidine phosphatase family protein [Pedobacter montanisoli]